MAKKLYEIYIIWRDLLFYSSSFVWVHLGAKINIYIASIISTPRFLYIKPKWQNMMNYKIGDLINLDNCYINLPEIQKKWDILKRWFVHFPGKSYHLIRSKLTMEFIVFNEIYNLIVHHFFCLNLVQKYLIQCSRS